MKIINFIKSSRYNLVLYAVACLLIASLIFEAGVFVGWKSATFSLNWESARFGQNIREGRSIFEPFQRDGDDRNPHGAIGEIVSIKLPSIMVKNPAGNEEIVIVENDTSFRFMNSEISSTSLSIGQQIVAIGSPDDAGRMHARFVRVMPPPPNRNIK